MRKIHQVHHSTSVADAITNQMRFIQSALWEEGIGGELFAWEQRGLPNGCVRTWDREAIEKGDLLLVHHSTGNPMLGAIRETRIPKALVYHNITPADFFEHDGFLSRLCTLGRAQLPELREITSFAFADSRFNASELTEMGFPPVEVLPLLHLDGAAEKRSYPPDHRLDPAMELLFVSKIAPHKNQALLIQALYHLNFSLGLRAHLTLVGAEDPIYGKYVRLLSRALGLERFVTITGRVADGARDALYREADAFVCLSLHEGFGIPLVEAMLHGVPIFALGVPGVRETLGGAGIELRTKRPLDIAETLRECLARADVLTHVASLQALRFEELAATQNRARVRQLCSALLEHPLPVVSGELGAIS